MGRWIRGPDSSCCYDDLVVKEQLAPFPSAVNPSSGFVLLVPAVALSQGGELGSSESSCPGDVGPSGCQR